MIPGPTPPREWVIQLINRSEDPYTSYKIDPTSIEGLVKDLGAKERHWDDVIIWHTHPSGSVGPSRGDLQNRIAGLTYIVVAIPTGEAVYF